jgi:hypothetical protein
VGYLRQADVIANQLSVGWYEPRPRGVFRTYSVDLAREDRLDFDGLQTGTSTSATVSTQFINRWRVAGGLSFSETVDTRALRGGPALRLSDTITATMSGGTDASRRFSATVAGRRARALDGGSGDWRIQTGLRFRPSNRLSLTANAGYTRAVDDLQYVSTVNAATGVRWVLARIDREVWDTTVRANLTLTPELTLQYYGSPFIATGRYTRFKRAADTLARTYQGRFHRFGADEIAYRPDANRYDIAEITAGQDSAYSIGNPDFSFQQLRSNLVLRWEYKPGSSAYIVWSQGRTGYASGFDGSLGNWDELWRSRPDNVILVKLSYWLSR